jgi:Mannosylglycerate hydrolase MGH1-like glycoside hydrolase domain
MKTQTTPGQPGAEQQRLAEAKRGIPWRKWGPYLSERQWGTVREDYSENGDAWNFFTHDHTRSRTYHPTGPGHFGVDERGILALVNPERLRRILSKMLDENEFLSPYGIRSISKFHEQHPYVFHAGGQEYRVDYLPAESNTGMFGGNSNWRGPIWMPVNAMLIRALLNFYLYYGDNFKIECPTGSGKMMNLFEVAKEISDRLTRIFLRNPSTGSGQAGKRPVYGGTEKFQTDPH